MRQLGTPLVENTVGELGAPHPCRVVRSRTVARAIEPEVTRLGAYGPPVISLFSLLFPAGVSWVFS
jgi:hypothetical protein